MRISDKTIELLLQVREKYPDWRLGQLISNVHYFASATAGKDLFYVEDDEWQMALQNALGFGPLIEELGEKKHV